MIKHLLLLFLFCWPALSATLYYVRTDGNNLNSGQADTVGGAWRTLTYAASQVQPGDTVYVGPGTFTEQATLTRAGTEGSQIKWYGDRTGGTWNTIIDRTIPMTTGWTLATGPGIEANVYKHTSMPFEPGLLKADDKSVVNIRTEADKFMVYAFEDTRQVDGGDQYPGTWYWWDGIEAAWMWNTNTSTAWIHFRGGAHPNTKSIRISQTDPRVNNLLENDGIDIMRFKLAAGVTMASYNTLSGFHVRGSAWGINIPVGCEYSIIESNKVDDGFHSINAGEKHVTSSSVRHNIVRWNTISMNVYGFGGGAWNIGQGTAGWIRNRPYRYTKSYWSEAWDVEAAASYFENVGNSNVVHNNVFNNVSAGAGFGGNQPKDVTGVPGVGNVIASNLFYNTSGQSIWVGFAGDHTHIHDNFSQDSRFFIRLQGINENRPFSNRIYYYRNRGWNPSMGSGMYPHINQDLGDTFKTEFWAYHNSWEGVTDILTTPSEQVDYSTLNLFSKFAFLNNILNATTASPIVGQSRIDDTAAAFRVWDYNRQRGALLDYVWVGDHNVVNGNYEWGAGTTPPASMPDFLIDEISPAWNTGTNLTGLNLPENLTMNAGVWDIGAHELITTTYYVAPSGGSDSNVGSYALPWATIAYGIATVQPGDTLILKNGTYNQRLVIVDKSGVSGAPITVRAETDFGVTLLGPIAGTSPYAHVFLRRADWWILQGFRVQDSYGYSVWLYGTQNTTLRKIAVIRPANVGNTHAFATHGDSVGWPGDTGRLGAFNLIEDCIAVDLHRHGFLSGAGSVSNVVRRCYVNSMGRTYADGTRGAVEAASNYGGSHNIYENILVARSDYIGITANGISTGGVGNRYLGCVVLGSERSAFLVNARTTDPDGLVTNTWNINCVALDRPTYNNQRRSSAGFSSWHGKNNYISNCFVLSQNEAFEVNQEQFFWDPDSTYGATRDPQLQFEPFNVKMNNNVAINSKWGFYHTWDSRTTPASSDMPYGGVHTTFSTNNLAYGNSTANQVITVSSRVVVNQSGFVTVNPGYNITKYGDGAYLMPAPNYPTRGATVLFRYVDGVLTTTPLWPWPTDAQIMVEIGKTATYEATGGIWKTLDGVYAPVYYVRKDGNDSNTGTSDTAGGAWLTIGKAASVVNPGDTVYVRAGVYKENVTLSRSGSSSSRITFQGEPGTIIDPSDAASSGWVQAPEKGTQVWKHISLPYEPGIITAGGKLIPRHVRNSNGGSPDELTWVLEPVGTYTKLNSPANVIFNTESDTYPVSFWDGIGAFWWWPTNGTAYIRYKNGDDPNSKSLRISYNAAGLGTTVNRSGISITGSFITVRGFEVRNAYGGIVIQPSVAGSAQQNWVLSNYVYNSYQPIAVGKTAVAVAWTVDGTVIAYNRPEHNWLAHTPGAWSLRSADAGSKLAYMAYIFLKTMGDPANSEPFAINLIECGRTNYVVGNTITNTGNGIRLYAHFRNLIDTTVASNTIHSVGSSVLMGFGNGLGRTWVHDNFVWDANSNFRFHAITRNRGFNMGTWYVYRNTVWQRPGQGNFSYVNIDTTDSLSTSPFPGPVQEIWVYHNSMQGGSYAISGPVSTAEYAALQNLGVYGKIKFVNNILLAGTDVFAGEQHLPESGSLGLGFGRWSHNHQRQALSVTRSWIGQNIINTDYEWPITTEPPDFLISSDSLSWNAGTNLASLGLPDNRIMDSGLWDIGAHEYITPIGVETSPVSIYFNPQSMPGPRNLSELGTPIELQVNRASDNVESALTGTWTWSGVLVANVDYTVTDNNSGTVNDHLNWTIPAGLASQTYYVTAIPDGTYTGPRNGQVEVQPGVGYTPSGGPAYFVWVDAQQPVGVTAGPERPGQYRPPHTLP